MQSYYIMQLAFYDSFLSTEPSQPYSYTYGDRPTFEFCFLPNEIAEGDTLIFAIDNDMVFYDSTPENLLHSASCMVVVRHDVTAEEATAGKVQMRIETRTTKFRDVVNGKVRPVEVISGLYRRCGSGDDINYVLLAKGRAMANGIIADYNALPEPITTADEFYSKTETDSLLDAKADKADLVAHTDDATIHVTQQEKTEWSNKADRNDIGNATITITQGGTSKGSFSVNASENVTIEVNDGAQADWTETDTSSPSYIQHKPTIYTQSETDDKLDLKADKASVYTKGETDALLDEKADKTSVYTKGETDAKLDEKADKTSVYTKTETDGLLNEKANVATTYTKDETNSLLDGKSDIDHLHTGKYVELNENGKIKSGYVVAGIMVAEGGFVSNEYFDADLGYRIKGVSLDSIYAAKSHTHAMGDITGLPASGGTIGQVLTKTETGSEWDYLPDTNDYLCFTAAQTNSTVKIEKFGTPPTINLEYSVDKKHWTEYTWNDKTGATITLANIGDKVWWRGNNTAFGIDFSNVCRFVMSGSIEASGNVMSLLDKTCKSVTIPTAFCFFGLFSLCASLKKAPKLPATTLADSCYYAMFNGCSSLMEAPELPATTLAEYCYDWMFHNCTSLTEAPELPATTMIEHCYDGMFQGCTSLTKAPELPATTLANWCYQNMFKGCSKINKVKVSFTSWGSTSTSSNWLINASTTGVFECPSALDCSTRDDSHVPAGWTIVRTDAPASGGTIGQVLTKTADGQEWADAPAGGGGDDITDYLCFTATQANSTVKLNKQGTPPTISLEYSTDKRTWTEYTWNDKTGVTITLVNIGDKVWWRGDNTAFSSDGNVYRFTMSGSIEASGNIMSLLDKTCKSVTIPTSYCFFRLFAWNLALKTAPELPATKLAMYCYYNMFEHCTSLTTAPELPATTMADYCYYRMFIDCTSLTTAPELPATTMADYCYYEMFHGCSSLTQAPKLPATTMKDYCYDYMFSGCSSLTEAPELPATTLAYKCYSNMFNSCTNLKKIKVNFAAWFFGASDNLVHTNNWLSNASSTGVFECPSALDCSTRDTSHVPAGWTIVRTDAPKSITSPTTASSEATYQVSPNTPSVPVVTVASAITLNASTVDSGSVAYAEIVLDVASGATVTAEYNLTLVDEITAGKRNICVCRWSEGVCKLYVVIVEDLPQA